MLPTRVGQKSSLSLTVAETLLFQEKAGVQVRCSLSADRQFGLVV